MYVCIYIFLSNNNKKKREKKKKISSTQYTPFHVTYLFSPLPQGCLEEIAHLAIRPPIVLQCVMVNVQYVYVFGVQ